MKERDKERERERERDNLLSLGKYHQESIWFTQLMNGTSYKRL